MDNDLARTRRFWRKTNAELQFMEYPALPPAKVYSVGCTALSGKALVAGLLQHGVTHLWDLRAGREGGFMLGREQLREDSRGRLQYREWQIGTAAAGGITRHLFHTEEGRTMIHRMFSEAQHATVCYVGTESEWLQDDLQMSVGVALSEAGAEVIHFEVVSHGNTGLAGIRILECEAHPFSFELPSHLKLAHSIIAQEGSVLEGNPNFSGVEQPEHVLGGEVLEDVHGAPCGNPYALQCADLNEDVHTAPRRRWDRRMLLLNENQPTWSAADALQNVSSKLVAERSRGRWSTPSRAAM